MRISMQFFSDNGDSGAGGAGGASATNMELNAGIASSRDWVNRLKPQAGNTETVDGGGLSKEKRIETIMHQLNCSRSMAEKYAAAIEDYGEHAAEIRSAQTSHNSESAHYQSGLDLESYIKSAPRWAGGTTYHTVLGDAAAFNANNAVGAELNLGGTTTWHSAKGNAKQRGGNVMLVSPTQSKGTGVNRISIHSGEKEVVASEASRYKIKRKYWEGSVLYVEVEEI